MPEHTDLPMRFDCKIEDSFINRTYKKAVGITIHGIICSNLINAGIRTKKDLEETVKHYDQIIEKRMEEVKAILKF